MTGGYGRPILVRLVRSATMGLRLTQALKRALVLDVALAMAALAASLALMTHGIGSVRAGSGLDLRGGLLAAATALPLIAWRRAPFIVFIVSGVASALTAALGYTHWIPIGMSLALYLLAASRGSAGWTRASALSVATLFILYLGATAMAAGTVPGIEFLSTGLAWAVAWFAGERTRLLREQMADLKARAVAVERAAESDRRLAVAEERARIARDLHDSAGHAINVIAVQAGAARLSHDRDPDRPLAALAEIEEIARQTAADVDGIVHSLRESGADDDGPAVPVGLASLSMLVGHHARSGLKVAVRTVGVQRPLTRAPDQAAYRILQEALTNAARHGQGDATLELAFEPAALRLTVVNLARAGRPVGTTGGHGLIGMRERAQLLGGTLEAGPLEGGFRVSALIPYEGPGGWRES